MLLIITITNCLKKKKNKEGNLEYHLFLYNFYVVFYLKNICKYKKKSK